MARPLYDKISEYRTLTRARFCMPGHGGEERGGLYACASYDWTEVKGLDNLLESEEVIAQSERLLAKDYGYDYALMLTCGATSGMQIALNAVKDREGRIIAVGDMHKSFWSACTLFGVKAQAVDCVQNADLTSGGVKAFFVTSPDYFGNTKDLKLLSEKAREVGALLIVDEAHAAHYPYSQLLPDNASKYADIAIEGMHKTLPIYGGGALLCVNGNSLYEKCRQCRALIHSTSPDYLVMASIDFAADEMRREGQNLYRRVKQATDEFARSLKKGKVVKTDDFSRVVIEFKGKDCYALSDALTERGIFVEAAYGDRLILIVTPYNCDKLQVLSDELDKIELQDGENPVLPVLKSCDVTGRESELIRIDQAEERISACEIGLYPPGVPAIKRGDLIDTSAMAFIKKYRNRLFGLASGRIAVIK